MVRLMRRASAPALAAGIAHRGSAIRGSRAKRHRDSTPQ
jgi:hypothetical protein